MHSAPNSSVLWFVGKKSAIFCLVCRPWCGRYGSEFLVESWSRWVWWLVRTERRATASVITILNSAFFFNISLPTGDFACDGHRWGEASHWRQRRHYQIHRQTKTWFRASIFLYFPKSFAIFIFLSLKIFSNLNTLVLCYQVLKILSIRHKQVSLEWLAQPQHA